MHGHFSNAVVKIALILEHFVSEGTLGVEISSLYLCQFLKPPKTQDSQIADFHFQRLLELSER